MNKDHQGWINLRNYVPKKQRVLTKAEEDAVFDRRLREAAVIMRRRWDKWNEEHGLEVDYDTLSQDFPYDDEAAPRRKTNKKTISRF
jgi:hypothetical protein